MLSIEPKIPVELVVNALLSSAYIISRYGGMLLVVRNTVGIAAISSSLTTWGPASVIHVCRADAGVALIAAIVRRTFNYLLLFGL